MCGSEEVFKKLSPSKFRVYRVKERREREESNDTCYDDAFNSVSLDHWNDWLIVGRSRVAWKKQIHQ